jgi:hypothetical protein
MLLRLHRAQVKRARNRHLLGLKIEDTLAEEGSMNGGGTIAGGRIAHKERDGVGRVREGAQRAKEGVLSDADAKRPVIPHTERVVPAPDDAVDSRPELPFTD